MSLEYPMSSSVLIKSNNDLLKTEKQKMSSENSSVPVILTSV